MDQETHQMFDAYGHYFNLTEANRKASPNPDWFLFFFFFFLFLFFLFLHFFFQSILSFPHFLPNFFDVEKLNRKFEFSAKEAYNISGVHLFIFFSLHFFYCSVHFFFFFFPLSLFLKNKIFFFNRPNNHLSRLGGCISSDGNK